MSDLAHITKTNSVTQEWQEWCVYIWGEGHGTFNTDNYIRCFIRVSLLLSGYLSPLKFILKLTPHKSQANGVCRRDLWKVIRMGCGHEGGALWLHEWLYLMRKRDEVSSLLSHMKWYPPSRHDPAGRLSADAKRISELWSSLWSVR